MIRRAVIGCVLMSACGVAETELLLTVPTTVPPTVPDGGIDPGEVVDPFDCTPTDFGPVSIDTCVESLVQCTNVSDYPLLVEGVTLTGALEFNLVPPPATLIDPNQTLLFSLAFCPTQTGPRTAWLGIR